MNATDILQRLGELDLFRFVRSAAHRDKPCVRLGQETLTYGVVDEVSRRLAGWFDRVGVSQGDRVVLAVSSDLEAIALYLSVIRVGVTAAVVDPSAPRGEMRNLVKAARACALFIDEHVLETGTFEDVLVGPRIQVPICHGAASPSAAMAVQDDVAIGERFLGFLGACPFGREPVDRARPETSAFILFTSGTTSKPKGVEVTHHALATHIASMHRQYGYDESSVVINGLPLHHSDGINHGAVNIVAAGGTLHRTGPFSVLKLPEVLGMIGSRRVTHLITVPTVIALIARLGREFDDVFRVPWFSFVSSTAGPLDERLWRSFEERFGTMVVNGYGLTETVCEGLYCGPTPETRRIGTVGKPIDVEIRIVDPNGKDVGIDEMGELLLKGSCLMKGYFEAPEETAQAIEDGWLRTGDLAVRDRDGFVAITGRKKNVIISGGINVYPEDVSRAISGCPGVRDVATIGVADPTWGERVVGCVVLEEGLPQRVESVMQYCRETMSKEKVPSQIVLLDSLPRGPSGKVALPELRRIVAERLASRPTDEVSRHDTGVARQVLEIAAEAFKTPVEHLELDAAPESTSGWDSLAHMDFLSSLEATFDIEIDPEDMLSIDTLGAAVEHVRRVTGRH